MKRIFLIIILLTSVTITAQGEKNDVKTTEVSKISFENSNEVIQNINIDMNSTTNYPNNTIIALAKYETFKATSRRSRVKNIINFLKNSEKKQDSILELC